MCKTILSGDLGYVYFYIYVDRNNLFSISNTVGLMSFDKILTPKAHTKIVMKLRSTFFLITNYKNA